jgi:hypothetical protein
MEFDEWIDRCAPEKMEQLHDQVRRTNDNDFDKFLASLYNLINRNKPQGS